MALSIGLLFKIIFLCVNVKRIDLQVKSHLKDMYTKPASGEQCLHNALKLVTAMRSVGIDHDVQAVDITDPNPIVMLMLVVELFHCLPLFEPKATVDFKGTLHKTITRQVAMLSCYFYFYIYVYIL